MDHSKMKAAIDTTTARDWGKVNTLELRGMVEFLRQQVVDAEWEIARATASIKAYQAVVEEIEKTLRPNRTEQ